jgi:hypothetical protein
MINLGRTNLSNRMEEVSIVWTAFFPAVHSQKRALRTKRSRRKEESDVCSRTLRCGPEQKARPRHHEWVRLTPTFFLSNDGHTVESLLSSVRPPPGRVTECPCATAAERLMLASLFSFSSSCVRRGTDCIQSRAARPQFYVGLS